MSSRYGWHCIKHGWIQRTVLPEHFVSAYSLGNLNTRQLIASAETNCYRNTSDEWVGSAIAEEILLLRFRPHPLCSVNYSSQLKLNWIIELQVEGITKPDVLWPSRKPICFWNDLCVTSAPSLAVFGRRLKTELFRRCYNAAWLFLTLKVVLEIDFLFRPL